MATQWRSCHPPMIHSPHAQPLTSSLHMLVHVHQPLYLVRASIGACFCCIISIISDTTTTLEILRSNMLIPKMARSYNMTPTSSWHLKSTLWVLTNHVFTFSALSTSAIINSTVLAATTDWYMLTQQPICHWRQYNTSSLNADPVTSLNANSNINDVWTRINYPPLSTNIYQYW